MPPHPTPHPYVQDASVHEILENGAQVQRLGRRSCCMRAFTCMHRSVFSSPVTPGRQLHRLPASHGLASGPFPPPQVSRVLGELGGALGLLEDLEENLAIFDAKLRHMREDIAGGAQPDCRHWRGPCRRAESRSS